MNLVHPVRAGSLLRYNELVKAECREPQTDGESPVCPHCIEPIERFDHFCPHCGRPVTAHASTDPLARVYAQGWAYQNATSGVRHPLVLVGMWLLFGPIALTCLTLAISLLLVNVMQGHFVQAVLLAIYFGAWFMLLAVILYKTTRNHIAKRRQQGEG